MGATVLLEKRDKGEKYIERRGERAKRRAAARTYVRRPPPTSGRRAVTPVYPQHIISETVERSFPLFPPTFVAFHPFHPPPPSRTVSLPLPLSLGLYLEMLPPTNKPQTLRSFTQS
ncbi:hypothetical protein ALC60_00258 [Trachymyrmex zeteki]|uniref:Uncharacterized protein n=1 Tax=Mycetomoellerius zeteki TaxID=64791 RepID=A0A151XJN3_9HYME|nr:hypothetical protein ALC60_00258 [Trachymyrmex zeteki]